MRKKHKENKIKVTYEVADIPEEERERRIARAFDILFEAVLKARLKKNKV